MSGSENRTLADEVVREAIANDLESVQAPDPDKAWARIEKRLDRQERRPRRLQLPLGASVALATAACLLLVVGLFGYYRQDNSLSPAAEPPGLPADEVLVLETEDDSEVLFDLEEDPMQADRAVDWEPHLLFQSDPQPPDWPERLTSDYSLSEALLLEAGNDPVYRGALYENRQSTLLLIKSEEEAETLDSFVRHLGSHVLARSRLGEALNGFHNFKADEQAGLAWQVNDRNKALLVLSGVVETQQLVEIAAGLDH